MEYEQNFCLDLRDLLSGTLGVEYFSEIETLRQHWETCENCRANFPDADAKVKRIEESLLAQIHDNIVLLHDLYILEKKDIIEKDALRRSNEHEERARKWSHTNEEVIDLEVFRLQSSEPNKPSDTELLYMQFVALLSENGFTIRDQLQVMNDSWGLDVFRLATNDGDCEYDSRFCGRLITSLPRDVRLFAFQAILTADFEALFHGEISPSFAFPIYQTVERAAPEFMRLYLDGQNKLVSVQSVVSPISKPDINQVPLKLERIEQLAKELLDVGDSLKAGQMEILRGQKKKDFHATEIEEDLRQYLTSSIFDCLSLEARRFLGRAEQTLRENPQKEEFRPSILDFQLAYECELKAQIIAPVLAELAANNRRSYPPNAQKKLVEAGKYNHKMTLGELLWLVERDDFVRRIVIRMGFNVNGILHCGSLISTSRNNAVHLGDASRKEAEGVRQAVFRGLKTLHKRGAA